MSRYRYMLDTNTVSLLLRKHPSVVQRILAVPMSSLCMSAITKGELLFGLAKRPEATQLHRAVHELFLRVASLPLDDAVMEQYGILRAQMEREGKNLSPFDMLIAAHCIRAGTTLVSNDAAFRNVLALVQEDWVTES